MLQIIHKQGQSYVHLAKSFQIFLYLLKTNVLLAQGIVIQLRPSAHPDPYQHKGIFWAEITQVVQSGFFSPASRTCTRKWELPTANVTSAHAGMWFSTRHTALYLYTWGNVNMLLHYYQTLPCSIYFSLLVALCQKTKWKQLHPLTGEDYPCFTYFLNINIIGSLRS